MVLPGIQALFGFQLIAVINEGFDKLSENEQSLHLAAIGLVAIAVALVMAPAALHRQYGPRLATEDFITVASRLLLFAMIPLMFAICLDFYIVARIILQNRPVGAVLSVVMLGIFSTLWFVLPRWRQGRL